MVLHYCYSLAQPSEKIGCVSLQQRRTCTLLEIARESRFEKELNMSCTAAFLRFVVLLRFGTLLRYTSTLCCACTFLGFVELLYVCTLLRLYATALCCVLRALLRCDAPLRLLHFSGWLNLLSSLLPRFSDCASLRFARSASLRFIQPQRKSLNRDPTPSQTIERGWSFPPPAPRYTRCRRRRSHSARSWARADQ